MIKPGILIADDEIAKAIGDHFKRIGFDVLLASRPEQALQKLEAGARALDVAVIDLWMDWKGQGSLDQEAGIKVLERIKRGSPLEGFEAIDPCIGVVVFTGHARAQEAECLEAGASAYVEKGGLDTAQVLAGAVLRAAVGSIQCRLKGDITPEIATALNARLAAVQAIAAEEGIKL